MSYEERFYRNYHINEDLIKFHIQEYESDLLILASKDERNRVEKALKQYRRQIAQYGKENPDFYSSLTPIKCSDNAPQIIRHMHRATQLVGVGPMASVAGAVSEYIGKELMPYCKELIIENGGDLFISSLKKRHIAVYAGNSPFSNKLALIIKPEDTPIGICTSAGTFGHSLSFGKADAAIVVSKDTLLADATATAVGNLVKDADSIPKAIDFAKSIEGVVGVLIIYQDKLGVWGKIELEKVTL